jgi:small-conductance mechanosensitive channel
LGCSDVIEKSLLVTRIRTIKNEIISIPNSTVMSSHTINYSSDGKGLIIHSTITIGYDVPWKDMHQALIDAATKTALVYQNLCLLYYKLVSMISMSLIRLMLKNPTNRLNLL